MPGETTYCLATNQPTNQPTDLVLPEEYVDVRLTIPHEEWAKAHEKVFFDMEWYISYPHTGSKTKKEHFHVFVPIGPAKYVERLRKRIKDHFGSGQRIATLRPRENCVASGIQYGSKEGTRPFIVGDECDEWIAASPPWEHRNAAGVNAGINQRPLKNVDHFRTITYMNMEKVCLRYRRENGISSSDLSDVLEHMHAHGWRLQISVLRAGIPSTMFEQFAAACDGRTIYCANRFNRMKTTERWKEGA